MHDEQCRGGVRGDRGGDGGDPRATGPPSPSGASSPWAWRGRSLSSSLPDAEMRSLPLGLLRHDRRGSAPCAGSCATARQRGASGSCSPSASSSSSPATSSTTCACAASVWPTATRGPTSSTSRPTRCSRSRSGSSPAGTSPTAASSTPRWSPLAGTAVVWSVSLSHVLDETQGAAASGSVAALYPVMDIVLLLALVLAIFALRRWNASAWLLFAGFGVMLVADTAFARLVADGTYSRRQPGSTRCSPSATSCSPARSCTRRCATSPRGSRPPASRPSGRG